MRIAIFLLFLLASACSCSKHGELSAHVSNNAPTRLYLAKTCENGMSESQREVVTASKDFIPADGNVDVCFVRGSEIYLDENIIHIKPIAKDEIRTEIPCARKESLSEVISALPAAGDMVLVAGNAAIHKFSYLNKKDFIGKCMVFPQSDFSASVALCESVRVGLGKNSDGCLSYCDAKKVTVLPDVCVVGNADIK